MLSDDELVEQILLENENAAEELIKRYYTSILRYCRWHCSNLEKAEDLTQETFLKLFKNLSGYKGKKKFKAYLYTIANHLCIDESRKVEFYPLEDEENIVHDNTSTLVLTTRNGWGKIALAKILTGLAFTVELFALLAVSNVISQLFFMGTAGWDMPIQNIKLIAVAPMNMLQAEIYEYAFVLLGAIGFAGIVMFISAAVKNNVLTLLLSLAVVYGPMMIAEYLPYKMQKALDLIPLVGSSTDIFRTNTFRILGKLIWSPYLLITIPVLIGILCMPFAIKSWSRRMKA